MWWPLPGLVRIAAAPTLPFIIEPCVKICISLLAACASFFEQFLSKGICILNGRPSGATGLLVFVAFVPIERCQCPVVEGGGGEESGAS